MRNCSATVPKDQNSVLIIHRSSRAIKLSVALWMLQVLLAALFLSAGTLKLVMPAGELARQITLPAPFMRFIAIAECLGALGLVLPGLLRIRSSLTPLAASGLVIIMAGATTVTALTAAPIMAVVPLSVGLLSGFVAYGRWRLAPLAPAATLQGAC
jgi:uncharacterized membrane protein YphA (DoxX/SURF4 family)